MTVTIAKATLWVYNTNRSLDKPVINRHRGLIASPNPRWNIGTHSIATLVTACYSINCYKRLAVNTWPPPPPPPLELVRFCAAMSQFVWSADSSRQWRTSAHNGRPNGLLCRISWYQNRWTWLSCYQADNTDVYKYTVKYVS